MSTFRNMPGGRGESVGEFMSKQQTQAAESNIRRRTKEAEVKNMVDELYEEFTTYVEVSDTFLEEIEVWKGHFYTDMPFIMAVHILKQTAALRVGNREREDDIEERAGSLALRWLDIQPRDEIKDLSRRIDTVIGLERRDPSMAPTVLIAATNAKQIISEYRPPSKLY